MSKDFTVKCQWEGTDEARVVANHTFSLRGLQNAYATLRRHRAEVWRTIPAVVDMADLIVWVEHDGQRLNARILADVVSALDINEAAGSAEWTWALGELGLTE